MRALQPSSIYNASKRLAKRHWNHYDIQLRQLLPCPLLLSFLSQVTNTAFVTPDVESAFGSSTILKQ